MIKDSVQLCGLWKKKNEKGLVYMTGSFLGIRVLVFANDKKGSDKAPDYKVVLAPREDRPVNHAPQSSAEAKGFAPGSDELPF